MLWSNAWPWHHPHPWTVTRAFIHPWNKMHSVLWSTCTTIPSSTPMIHVFILSLYDIWWANANNALPLLDVKSRLYAKSGVTLRYMHYLFVPYVIWVCTFKMVHNWTIKSSDYLGRCYFLHTCNALLFSRDNFPKANRHMYMNFSFTNVRYMALTTM